MLRVDACAYIFTADKPEKIKKIMEDREVSKLEAGRIYTIGALKAAKRRGTAATYREALEALEAEQLGDRGCTLTRTVSMDRTAGDMARLRGMTNGAPTYTAHIDYVRLAWARMDNQPIAEYIGTIPSYRWQDMPKYIRAPYKKHPANVGKVLGSMYAALEVREEQASPEYAYTNSILDENMRVFFQEYKSRLSRTVKERLVDLNRYIQIKAGNDVEKAGKVIKAVTSAEGAASSETSKMHNFIANLHRNFVHRETLTRTELTELIYRYGGE
jgi:hypothetical protein